MSVEFRVTSDFRELTQIAEQRNASPEWRGVLEIKSSVNRIVKLRGRPPLGSDVSDILYDLVDFAGVDITQEKLLSRLSQLAELESTYYPLAENFGTRTALQLDKYERVPDFIDVAKDGIARTVWFSWKPEKGEDFIDLHARVLGRLKKHLVHGWYNTNGSQPFSHTENYRLVNAKPIQETDTNSPRIKPIYRLRQAVGHLCLPSLIAAIDTAEPLEKISSLALLGYYPDGRGLTGVAKTIGVKRETLSEALDRATYIFSNTPNGAVPTRGINEIVTELIEEGVLRYPSGKNVERTNPRLNLLKADFGSFNLSPMEREIARLAVLRKGNILTYSSEELAEIVGTSKVSVCRVIKGVSARLQQSIH